MIGMNTISVHQSEFFGRPRAARATRFFRFVRTEPFVAACLGLFVILAICTILPGLVAPSDPATGQLSIVRKGPSFAHPFGTDALGRDVLSRVIYGTRISLEIGVVSTLLGAALGGLVGLVAGFSGGIIDSLIMRFVDVMMAFPGILLAMAIIAARGRGVTNLLIAIGIGSIPSYARLVRGQVLTVRRRPYIEASLAGGAGPTRLMVRHILPNILSPVMVLATIGIGFSLLAGSSLSFIGLGAQPPSPEWGAMLADGRSFLNDAWWIATFPGLAIFFTVVAINVTGQWLRERFDPKRTTRRRGG
jgi:peptide/nickel transport system permease protein